MELILLNFILHGGFFVLCAAYFHNRIKARKSVLPAIISYLLVLLLPMGFTFLEQDPYNFLAPLISGMAYSLLAWVSASLYILWKTRNQTHNQYLFTEWMKTGIFILVIVVYFAALKEIPIGKIGG
ncbi:MAG: hypothetical protein EP332_13260 [Bacteroidetes bacterium]|nr:MAG: hypothetical protein EP332_13260 [Bacteroidota bacterium]